MARTRSSTLADERAPLLENENENENGYGTGKLPDEPLEPKTLSKTRSILLVAMLSCIGFLNIFTAQATIIMIPSIGRSYAIPISRQQLITSVFNISSGCLILLWGRLADIYGKKSVFLAGASVYTVVSILLPFSPNEIGFYSCRALQGVGIAAAVPSSIGIMASTFPAGKTRNTAFVVYNASASLGAVMGNIAGGVIGGYLSWEWVFWFAAILGGFTTASASLLIPGTQNDLAKASDEDKQRPYVDWIGGALATMSLMALLIPLSNAGGWKHTLNPVLLTASILLGIGFILWERRLELDASCQPLVRLSIFKSTQFSAALVTYAVFLASFNSFLIYVSFFFQQYLGLSVLQATWRFIPSGISGCLMALLMRKALSAISGFHLLVFAIICGTISPLLFALPIPPSTSYWAYAFPAIVLTYSVEIVAIVISLFVVQRLPAGDQGLGGGLLQTANNIGKALGLAFATSVQVAVSGEKDRFPGEQLGPVEPGDPQMLTGMRAAQWVNVSLAVVSLVIVMTFFRGLKKS